MGFAEMVVQVEGEKWVIAGVSTTRAPLRQIRTRRNMEMDVVGVEEFEDDAATTPTAKEARIPDRLPCPPAPRKRRPAAAAAAAKARWMVKEFFNPPDLETVFIRHVERAS
ncbi:hypothetical protein Syun_020450 [Stephania yunnanensis]|uniref:Uncharacterized protein n=1 Tax=Stephania yunnanensis TaxID=152371 RepID=A0AAP0IDY6_9MAGN